MNFSRNKMTVVISTGILVTLFAMSVYQMSQEVIVQTGQVIVDDVARLKSIMDQIDARCGIIGFAHEHNYIDFLNVKSFEGSEVGAMNLANPQGWQGPYLLDNPICQGIVYEIVRTDHGYYLVPGTGVRLPDGRTIGKEVLARHHAVLPIPYPLHELETLTWNDRALYAAVPTRNLRMSTCCNEPEGSLSD
jgi:hypothetical protein